MGLSPSGLAAVSVVVGGVDAAAAAVVVAAGCAASCAFVLAAEVGTPPSAPALAKPVPSLAATSLAKLEPTEGEEPVLVLDAAKAAEAADPVTDAAAAVATCGANCCAT